MKAFFKLIPESYFILSVAYYWVMTGTLFNPYAIVLLAGIGFLMIYRNKILGLFMSLLFILVNLFMFGALMSEYREFHEPTRASHHLILYGSLYLGLNLLMAVIMLIKYVLGTSGTGMVRPTLS